MGCKALYRNVQDLCVTLTLTHPTLTTCTSCGAKRRLQERYVSAKVLGQGAFGKTFLAIDEGKPSRPKCVIKQFISSAVAQVI